MRQTSLVVFPRVDFWIVVPDPAPNFEEAKVRSLGVGLDGLCISCMQLLSIQKSGLLQDADPLEPGVAYESRA